MRNRDRAGICGQLRKKYEIKGEKRMNFGSSRTQSEGQVQKLW